MSTKDSEDVKDIMAVIRQCKWMDDGVQVDNGKHDYGGADGEASSRQDGAQLSNRGARLHVATERPE
jgi:hypothetical protein